MAMSPLKTMRVKQGAILGFVVGIFLFIFFYLVNPASGIMYMMFIPLAAGMGAAVQFVRDEDTEDD
jgi:hypothetical protein